MGCGISCTSISHVCSRLSLRPVVLVMLGGTFFRRKRTVVRRCHCWRSARQTGRDQTSKAGLHTNNNKTVPQPPPLGVQVVMEVVGGVRGVLERQEVLLAVGDTAVAAAVVGREDSPWYRPGLLARPEIRWAGEEHGKIPKREGEGSTTYTATSPAA